MLPTAYGIVKAEGEYGELVLVFLMKMWRRCSNYDDLQGFVRLGGYWMTRVTRLNRLASATASRT
jgi:hypothetical protein